MFNVSLKRGDEDDYSVSDVEDPKEKRLLTTLPHKTFHPDNALSPSRKTLRDGTPIYMNSMNIKKIRSRGEYIDDNEIAWVSVQDEDEESKEALPSSAKKGQRLNRRDEYIVRYYKSYLHKKPPFDEDIPLDKNGSPIKRRSGKKGRGPYSS